MGRDPCRLRAEIMELTDGVHLAHENQNTPFYRSISELTVLLLYLLKYLEQLLHGLGPQHGDAQLLEIGQSLEERCGCQVAAYVQYATPFVESGNASVDLLAQDIHTLIKGEWR